MKKLALALALALACASCATYRPMELRLVPVATDAELVAELRGLNGRRAYDHESADRVAQVRAAVLK